MKLYSEVLALLTLFFVGTAVGKDPGAVYAKNAGKSIMHLWVNGSYQGYLKPGETRYTVSDGFITNDSGNGRDGKPVKESHGGWENDKSGTVQITIQHSGGEKESTTRTANAEGDVILSANEANSKSKPEPATDSELENAPAIIKGNMPNLAKKSPGNPPEAPATPSLVGRWQWTPSDQIVTINENGTTSSSYGVRGTWSTVNSAKGVYSISWQNGFKDTVTVSKDGATATQSNQYGAAPQPFRRLR